MAKCNELKTIDKELFFLLIYSIFFGNFWGGFDQNPIIFINMIKWAQIDKINTKNLAQISFVVKQHRFGIKHAGKSERVSLECWSCRQVLPYLLLPKLCLWEHWHRTLFSQLTFWGHNPKKYIKFPWYICKLMSHFQLKYTFQNYELN